MTEGSSRTPAASGAPSGFARALEQGHLRLAGSGSAATGLRRFTQPRQGPRPGEVCELCTAPLDERHAHLVDTSSRALKCTCRPCALLFTHEGAGAGKFKVVPDRYLHDPSFDLTPAQWEAAQIPVNTAFFFHNSALERAVCFYPSPGGATESLLDLDAWAEVLAANPGFSDLTPDVEALLVTSSDGVFECFLVPIDACYELVGRVKLRWKGFSGGEELWQDVGEFFAGLRARSRPLPQGGQP